MPKIEFKLFYLLSYILVYKGNTEISKLKTSHDDEPLLAVLNTYAFCFIKFDVLYVNTINLFIVLLFCKRRNSCYGNVVICNILIIQNKCNLIKLQI